MAVTPLSEGKNLAFSNALTATQILSNYRELNMALEAEKLANLIQKLCTRVLKSSDSNTVLMSDLMTDPNIEKICFEIHPTGEIYLHYRTHSPNESSWDPLLCDVDNIYWCLKADFIITHPHPEHVNFLSDYKKHMAKLAPVLRRLPEITADFI